MQALMVIEQAGERGWGFREKRKVSSRGRRTGRRKGLGLVSEGIRRWWTLRGGVVSQRWESDVDIIACGLKVCLADLMAFVFLLKVFFSLSILGPSFLPVFLVFFVLACVFFIMTTIPIITLTILVTIILAIIFDIFLTILSTTSSFCLGFLNCYLIFALHV
ncbi:hypothetical protein L202_06149 [Cryptococcus amylolentus CBS 6039]|uniref:SSD domain-containing protein n=1 Tax=Cryptococcus amylolentus CBS 6039 TaxID=1295533 RepID=A0A1E3HIR0_9TREE|nr:hypothetical protein L202_06149 [Cryptococcus amylolentus CBS 6039]ODN76228.1 hypothetical protein L202_06149 [Cryptococcus amylolentus CBS 6039]